MACLDDQINVLELDQELIAEYLKGPPNLRFEKSMIRTLIDDEKYEMVLSCFEKGFTWKSSYVRLFIQSGNLSLYQYLDQKGKLPLSFSVGVYIVKNNNLETLQWMWNGIWTKRYMIVEEKMVLTMMMVAVEYNHREIFTWLYVKCRRIPMEFIKAVLEKIIQNYSVEMLEWVLTLYTIKMGCFICDMAVKYQKMEFLQWGLHRGETPTDEAYIYAFINNDFEMVKYLFSLRIRFKTDPSIKMITRENLHMLKWLFENGCQYSRWDHYMMKRLIELEELETIQWLVINGWEIEPYMYESAAGSSLNILQYLHKHRPDINLDKVNLSIIAAENGKLDILKWLNASFRNIPPSQEIKMVDAAFKSQNMEVYNWVVQRNMPSSENLLSAVKYGWSLDIIKPMSEGTCTKVFKAALHRKDLEIITHLANYTPRDKGTFYQHCCYDDSIPILEFLYSQRYKRDRDSCKIACKNNQMKAFVWLVEHGFYWDPFVCKNKTTSPEIIKWIHKRCRLHNKYVKYASYKIGLYQTIDIKGDIV